MPWGTTRRVVIAGNGLVNRKQLDLHAIGKSIDRIRWDRSAGESAAARLSTANAKERASVQRGFPVSDSAQCLDSKSEAVVPSCAGAR